MWKDRDRQTDRQTKRAAVPVPPRSTPLLLQILTSVYTCSVLRVKHVKQAVREAATICPRPQQVDLCPSDLESGVRVTCDVAYLCANFSLPRPLCSRLRPDVRDRQTSDVHHCLMPLH